MEKVDLRLESGDHSIECVFNVLEAEFPWLTLRRLRNVYQVCVLSQPARELGILYLVIRIPQVRDEAHNCIVEKTCCQRIDKDGLLIF